MLTLKRFCIYNGGDRFQIASLNGDVHFTQTWGQFHVIYNTSVAIIFRPSNNGYTCDLGPVYMESGTPV